MEPKQSADCMLEQLLTEEEFRELLRLQVKQAGGMRAYAQTLGMDRGNFSKMLSGKRPLTPQLMAMCGFERVVMLRRKLV